jgi:pSer/pThr/pTyr-binding forkhead associated (FHA) protein
MIAAASLEETLLVLKVAFLVLLYLFIWRIVRAAARDVRSSQESMILSPQQAQSLGLVSSPNASPPRGRLVVLQSSVLDEGAEYELDAAQVTVGRGGNNDLALVDDEFASARHARIEPRRDGVYVEDVGSTNGTFVNGIRLARERRLAPGDVVRIGETELRFES